MRNPVVTLGDQDHFTQEWTWREKRKDKDGRRRYGRYGGNKDMSCAYCGKYITEEEKESETFVWIREFKYRKKKSEMEFIGGGFSKVVHRRCFVLSYVEEHPCKRGLVE
jgi:hypothetical protein